MTITLPAEVQQQAERQAKAGGFASVGEYLADLVREDEDETEWPTPPGGISTAEELRAAVAAGLASPPIPSVEDFFAKLRRVAGGGAA